MKKNLFDIAMIIVMAAFLSLLIYLDWLRGYGGFLIIPMLIFYYLGQFSERKYGQKGGNTEAQNNTNPPR